MWSVAEQFWGGSIFPTNYILAFEEKKKPWISGLLCATQRRISSAKDTSVGGPGARCSTCRAPSAVGRDRTLPPFGVHTGAHHPQRAVTRWKPVFGHSLLKYSLLKTITYNWSQNHVTLTLNEHKTISARSTSALHTWRFHFTVSHWR